MNDMNDLCRRAARLLGDPVPDQWTPLDYLDALEAKLLPRDGLKLVVWCCLQHWAAKYVDITKIGAHEAILGQFYRSKNETHARFQAAVGAAEKLKEEGKWDE